jgi:hypothetical protein
MERPDNTIRFLRMTAGQLRRLAERVPEIADELRAMAQQLEPRPTIWIRIPNPRSPIASEHPVGEHSSKLRPVRALTMSLGNLPTLEEV